MDRVIQLNDSQFDVICNMVMDQNNERLEQFATCLCKTIKDDYGFECLVAEDFQQWPSDTLEQTET